METFDKKHLKQLPSGNSGASRDNRQVAHATKNVQAPRPNGNRIGEQGKELRSVLPPLRYPRRNGAFLGVPVISSAKGNREPYHNDEKTQTHLMRNFG